MIKNYQIEYTYSARNDIRKMKSYILKNFKYRELGKSFTRKIRKAAHELRVFPNGYNTTGFRFRGCDIYLKPCDTYLLFYTIDEITSTVTVLRVLQDGMNWQYVIKRWIIENR